MSHFEYLPQGFNGKLSHVIEECGEVLAAAGKTLRFGLESSNPLTSDPETNREWLLRELKDLKQAISRIIPELWDDGNINGDVTKALSLFDAQDRQELDFCYEGGEKDAVMVAVSLGKYVRELHEERANAKET